MPSWSDIEPAIIEWGGDPLIAFSLIPKCRDAAIDGRLGLPRLEYDAFLQSIPPQFRFTDPSFSGDNLIWVGVRVYPVSQP